MVAIAGMLVSPARAQQQPIDDVPRIQQGLAIAPVPLKLTGLDQNLVGLGSYIVNAVGDCNGCHSAGPQTEWAPGFNPYLGQAAKANPATYLGGGRDFGPFPSATPAGAFPDIISRNLTPDKSGLPAGGHTLQEFTAILRNGRDFDNLHPNCTGAPNGTCLPAPFRGDLLQIMRWPAFQYMTDHEIAAIYEYLKAIPCIAGPTDPTNPLHNDCPGPTPPGPTGLTIVVTGPGGATSATNTFSTFSSEVILDASLSASSNPGALTFSWTPAPGYTSVSIAHYNTATATLQLAFHGTYQFTLTVTDATGLSATATITVQYI